LKISGRIRMKVLVLHHSKYGCGKTIAEAIAKGIRRSDHSVDVASVKELSSYDLERYGFFVIGTPTHVGSPTFKVKGTIKNLGRSCQGTSFTTFTTWMDPKQKTLEKLEMLAKRAGLEKLMEGAAFMVKSQKGPLEDGSAMEAERFGQGIGEKL